jgi:MFS family permease
MANISGAPQNAVARGGVERRLARVPFSTDTVIALFGCLVVFVGDTQSLSLIPLLSQVEKQYAMTPTQASWTLSALTIAAAASVPTLTRLGDRFGMRRLVLLGLTMGVLGNLLSAVAPGMAVLVIGRAVRGISAALPLTYALLRERSPLAHGTNRGVGIMTAAVGFGVALSFLLSGLVIQSHGSVRTVFWIMTALALIALVARWAIQPDPATRSREEIDYLGVAGVAAGLICIVLAVSQGDSWGWSSARIIGLFAAGIVIFAGWVAVELRSDHPMINVRLAFRRTTTSAFIVCGLCSFLAIYSNLAVATYLETPRLFGYGLGASVLTTGFYLCPIAVFVMFGGSMVAAVIRRLGTKWTMALGGAIIAADFFWFATAHSAGWEYVVANCFWGLGYSLAFSAGNSAYLLAARDGEAAMFSSANTVVTAGLAGLGASVFATVLTSKLIPGTPIPSPDVYTRIWLLAACAGGVIILLALASAASTFKGGTATVAADPEEAATAGAADH